jgi:DNA invertase Pin-like site-specific DNA recombinase
MATYGYARVSTGEQSLDVQIAALEAAGCEIVRSEKISGVAKKRPELNTLLSFLRRGDTLVATRLDRLARSTENLHALVADLERRGIGLRFIEQPFDTTTTAGRAFLGMLGVFAAFERDMIKERQREGIEAGKARGIYRGKPKRVDPARIVALAREGKRNFEIAAEMGIDRTTVFRALKAAKGAAT